MIGSQRLGFPYIEKFTSEHRPRIVSSPTSGNQWAENTSPNPNVIRSSSAA